MAEDSERTGMAADTERTRLAAHAPWSSMGVNCGGVCLGDNGGILEDLGSSQRVRDHPGIALTRSFSSNPAVQESAGFLDVPGVPSIKESEPFFCLAAMSLLTRHGDIPCYDGL